MAQTQQKPRKSLLTPKFRVSFPSVFEKASYNNGTPRYSVVGLFNTAEFSEEDKKKWQAIREALNVASVEAFKKPYKELDRSAYRLPFRKGEEKEHLEGYGPGIIFFTMASTKRKPQVVNRDGSLITDPSDFYAGCYARASVIPYAFNNIGKGLAIGLGNLQKIADGESFAGFTSADDDFGGDAAEFDSSSDDFGGGDDDFA